MAGRLEGEIVVVSEGEEVQLECVVGDARPEPSVTWYQAGLPVDSGEYLNGRTRKEGEWRGRVDEGGCGEERSLS